MHKQHAFYLKYTNTCFLIKQLPCILHQLYTASILHFLSIISQFSWKFGKRNTSIHISHSELKVEKTPNPEFLPNDLNLTASDHHFWPKFKIMASEKQAITKQLPYGYFVADPSYSAITKVLISVSCCLAKVHFYFNGDWQPMNLDTLVKW